MSSLNHLPPLSAREGDGGFSFNSLTEAETVEGGSSQGTVTVSLSMLGISILREQERLAQTAFRFTDLGLLRWWESGAEKERQVASEIQAGAKGDLDSVMAEEEKTGGQI